MKKIGIISELNLKNVNYGNRLQAFALNNYISMNYSNFIVESILLKGYDEKIFTKNVIINKIKIIILLLKNKFIISSRDKYFEKRLNNCNNFTKKNTVLSRKELTRKMLIDSEYDIFIVGSDVVWSQRKNVINRIRFLDFGKKKVKKISYAASFGRDWIPDENKKIIQEKLNDFSYISVREKSSIELLKEINIDNAVHVCDPTLLIGKVEWENFSEKPRNLNLENRYVFVYLLGKDEEQRAEIKRIAKKENLFIVDIPHANGIYDEVDVGFSDINIDDCSPENWLWLIKNCEYFFTDSFHGAVFATIFEKKFLILTREGKEDINNRMIDYMNTIDSSDKFVDLKNVTDINEIEWDYDKVNRKVEIFRKKSKKFLENALDIK